MDCNRFARKSFGMLKICKNCVLLSYAGETRRKKKEGRKKEAQMNKIKIFKFVFFQTCSRLVKLY